MCLLRSDIFYMVLTLYLTSYMVYTYLKINNKLNVVSSIMLMFFMVGFPMLVLVMVLTCQTTIPIEYYNYWNQDIDSPLAFAILSFCVDYTIIYVIILTTSLVFSDYLHKNMPNLTIEALREINLT